MMQMSIDGSPATPEPTVQHPDADAGAAPRVVLFDVDGTLAETERDGHRVAFNRAFEAAGMKDRWDPTLYGSLLSVAGGKHRLEHFFTSQKSRSVVDARALAAELHASKTELFLEIVLSGQISPRSGVRALVQDLQRRGVVTGIVTTGQRAWVEPLVDHLLGRDAYVEMKVIVTGDDVVELKPSPEAYLLAMQKLMLNPDRGIAIEDSINGVEAAKAAGLACVAVPSLYNRDDDFSMADLVVAEFEETSAAGGSWSLLDNPEFQELLYSR